MSTKKPKKPAPDPNAFAPLVEEDRKALIKEIKKARAPAAIIADAYGVSRNTVKYHAGKLSIQLPDGTKMDAAYRDDMRAKVADSR